MRREKVDRGATLRPKLHDITRAPVKTSPSRNVSGDRNASPVKRYLTDGSLTYMTS